MTMKLLKRLVRYLPPGRFHQLLRWIAEVHHIGFYSDEPGQKTNLTAIHELFPGFLVLIGDFLNSSFFAVYAAKILLICTGTGGGEFPGHDGTEGRRMSKERWTMNKYIAEFCNDAIGRRDSSLRRLLDNWAVDLRISVTLVRLARRLFHWTVLDMNPADKLAGAGQWPENFLGCPGFAFVRYLVEDYFQTALHTQCEKKQEDVSTIDQWKLLTVLTDLLYDCVRCEPLFHRRHTAQDEVETGLIRQLAKNQQFVSALLTGIDIASEYLLETTDEQVVNDNEDRRFDRNQYDAAGQFANRALILCAYLLRPYLRAPDDQEEPPPLCSRVVNSRLFNTCVCFLKGVRGMTSALRNAGFQVLELLCAIAKKVSSPKPSAQQKKGHKPESSEKLGMTVSTVGLDTWMQTNMKGCYDHMIGALNCLASLLWSQLEFRFGLLPKTSRPEFQVTLADNGVFLRGALTIPRTIPDVDNFDYPLAFTVSCFLASMTINLSSGSHPVIDFLSDGQRIKREPVKAWIKKDDDQNNVNGALSVFRRFEGVQRNLIFRY
jgi:hypothetical protein